MAHPAYVLASGPDVEPLSVAEAKLWLRVDDSADDALIAGLIEENRRRAERVTGRALVTQSWRLYLDAFPDVIEVEMPPLASVASITYADVNGDTQTLATTVYEVDSYSTPARITTAYGQWWPSTYERLNAVTVSFTAGTAAGGVDAEFVGRLKAAVAHCYRNRERRDEAWLDQLFASLWCGIY